MGRFLVETLLVGRDEQAAERFLLLAVGVSTITFWAVTLVESVGLAIPGIVEVLFTPAYLLGTVLLAGLHAYRNDGFLVTLVGAFIVLLGYAVFIGMTYVLCLGASGCPTLPEKLFFGVFLAAGATVPIGVTAFTVGAGGRRLQERKGSSL